MTALEMMGDHPEDVGSELEIVVELGNLVPRNNLVSQKVFMALRLNKVRKQFSQKF